MSVNKLIRDFLKQQIDVFVSLESVQVVCLALNSHQKTPKRCKSGKSACLGVAFVSLNSIDFPVHHVLKHPDAWQIFNLKVSHNLFIFVKINRNTDLSYSPSSASPSSRMEEQSIKRNLSLMPSMYSCVLTSKIRSILKDSLSQKRRLTRSNFLPSGSTFLTVNKSSK